MSKLNTNLLNKYSNMTELDIQTCVGGKVGIFTVIGSRGGILGTLLGSGIDNYDSILKGWNEEKKAEE